MKIYKLSVDDYEALDYDEREAMVVLAPSEAAARRIAWEHDGEEERWLDDVDVECFELGVADRAYASLYPDAGGVVLDQRAGLA